MSVSNPRQGLPPPPLCSDREAGRTLEKRNQTLKRPENKIKCQLSVSQ